MSGSFDFNAANFASIPTKVGTPVLAGSTTLLPANRSAPLVALKSNRIGITIKPIETDVTKFASTVRFVLSLSFDGGTSFAPFRTYSAIPGIHSALDAGGNQTSGVYDALDVQATHAKFESYAWGSSTTTLGVSVRLFG